VHKLTNSVHGEFNIGSCKLMISIVIHQQYCDIMWDPQIFLLCRLRVVMLKTSAGVLPGFARAIFLHCRRSAVYFSLG
jgi:hypothetical protein